MKLFADIIAFIATGILIFILLFIFIGSFMLTFKNKKDETEEKINS